MRLLRANHRALNFNEYSQNPLSKWAIVKEGYLLNDPAVIKSYDVKRVIVAVGDLSNVEEWGERIRKSLSNDTVMMFAHATNPKVKGCLRDALEARFEYKFLDGFEMSAHRVYIHARFADLVNASSPGKWISSKLRKFVPFKDGCDWLIYGNKTGSLDKKISDSISKMSFNPASPVIFCELEIDRIGEVTTSGIVPEHWRQRTGILHIPFDTGARVALEARSGKEIYAFVQLQREELRLRKDAERKEAETAIVEVGSMNDDE